MKLLDGKTGLIFGVANERSIAWHIAKRAIEEGARCAFSYLPGEKMERRIRKTLADGGVEDPWLHPCDLTNDEDLDRLFSALAEDFGRIDFVVHSVAYADRDYLKPGTFVETPRDVFAQALDVSAYTLIAIANRARGLMKDGGSILALTYYGAEKAIPGYNVMGVAGYGSTPCRPGRAGPCRRRRSAASIGSSMRWSAARRCAGTSQPTRWGRRPSTC